MSEYMKTESKHSYRYIGVVERGSANEVGTYVEEAWGLEPHVESLLIHWLIRERTGLPGLSP